jgi:hypothetical protein
LAAGLHCRPDRLITASASARATPVPKPFHLSALIWAPTKNENPRPRKIQLGFRVWRPVVAFCTA